MLFERDFLLPAGGRRTDTAPIHDGRGPSSGSMQRWWVVDGDRRLPREINTMAERGSTDTQSLRRPDDSASR